MPHGVPNKPLVPCMRNILLICWSEEFKRLPQQYKLLLFPVLPTERKGKPLLLKTPGFRTWRNGAGADWILLPKEAHRGGRCSGSGQERSSQKL